MAALIAVVLLMGGGLVGIAAEVTDVSPLLGVPALGAFVLGLALVGWVTMREARRAGISLPRALGRAFKEAWRALWMFMP